MGADKQRHVIDDARTRVELGREYALRVIQAQQSLLSEADGSLDEIVIFPWF